MSKKKNLATNLATEALTLNSLKMNSLGQVFIKVLDRMESLRESDEHFNVILKITNCIVEEHTRNSMESLRQTNGYLNWIIEESASSYITFQMQCVFLRKSSGMNDELPGGKNDLSNGIIE